MELPMNLQITYESTSDVNTAIGWLNNLVGLVAFDFEVGSKYTKAEKEKFKELITKETDKEVTRTLKQKMESDGLSHPSLTKVTHMSIGLSETEGKVIIFDSDEMLKKVMNWLVTTDVCQVWHNAAFDFKHVYYYTKQIPKNYEDTQLRAKCLLNHVDVWKANSQLKHLMGYKYGKWAVANTMFTRENIYDEALIKYAAIDACATYALWESISNYVERSNKKKEK